MVLFTAFDILHQQLSYLRLIILVCSFKVSLEVVFSWPDFVLLLAGRSGTSIVKLGSFDSQHTMAGLLVSC